MPAKERFKTKYPGVYYIEGFSDNGKAEKVFYIRYRKNGKMTEEKAGRQFKDAMTAARANQIRGQRIAGKQKTNKERRASQKAKSASQRAFLGFGELHIFNNLLLTLSGISP